MRISHLNASQQTKHTPIGEIPVEWESARLGRVATMARGRFSVRPRNDPRYYGGPWPFAQTGDIASAGRELHHCSQTLNSDGLKVSKTFPAGTILMTIAANIGCVSTATFEVACPDSIVGIRPRDGVSGSWLYYALAEKRADLEANAPQNAQRNVNLQVLDQLPIALPPLPEQRKIAEVLSAWDQAIEQTEKLIAAKQRLKKGLMHLLLTGKLRFPQFGRPARPGDGNPDGWSRARLADVFERVTRTVGDAPEVEPVSITATVGFVPQREKFSKVIAGKQLQDYILLRRGEFAYNKGNSDAYPQGCIHRLMEYEQAAVPHVYYCFRANSAGIDPRFYAFYFRLGLLNRQLSRLINSGVRNDGLLNLPADGFFRMTVMVPPVAEQQRIASVLSACDAELSALRQQLRALQRQKKGLMQKLLTGRTRIPAAGAEQR